MLAGFAARLHLLTRLAGRSHSNPQFWGSQSLRRSMDTSQDGTPLSEIFESVKGKDGLLTLTGFGSLLSKKSAKSTFPDLQNWRVAKVKGFRRVFAHSAAVFHERGIARTDTNEVGSLSCEEHEGQDLLMTVFEVPATEQTFQALVDREHEFRFVPVTPEELNNGHLHKRQAILCGCWTDKAYRRDRCPEDLWQSKYAKHGIDQVWWTDNTILPCRLYLRHCILAAKSLGKEVEDNFMDFTFLADRSTSIRQYMQKHADIMDERPPKELADRYSG